MGPHILILTSLPHYERCRGTAEETLEDAVKAVEDKLEAYIDKNGSAYAFSFTTAIENAFKDANIEIKDLPVDKTFYF